MSQPGKKICVVGLGYIGLPTAAVLASRGFEVHGVEIDPQTITTINAGKTHIVEPDLDMLVQAGVQTGRLRAYSEPTEADVFILCVPTPLDEQQRPNMEFVEQATQAIAPYVRAGALIVLESTCPPGATERLATQLETITGFAPPEISIAHAPERVLPGRVLREVVENDRIIGGIDSASTEACCELYQHFVTGKLLRTQARTAEIAKLVENAYRDVNIAFANELSLVAAHLGTDVWEVIRLANKHPRVQVLSPGPGVGGHCLAVDPYFLIDAAPEQTPLIATAREVNLQKPAWIVQRVLRVADRFKSPRIACLGLAYKPDIDDLRESPAVAIAYQLQDQLDGELRIVEPHLSCHTDFELMTAEEALLDADIALLLVAHESFRALPKHLFAEKIILDECGLFWS